MTVVGIPTAASMSVNGGHVPTVNLRSSTGYYLSAANGGGSTVAASAAAASTSETFSVSNLSEQVLRDGDLVMLRASAGQYVRAPALGTVSADSSGDDTDSVFEIFDVDRPSGSVVVSGDRVTLVGDGGFYMRALGGGGASLTLDATTSGAWETFTLSGSAATPTSPPPPLQITMSQDSAVRSCQNYSDLGSVYEPDAASCLAHCQAEGANACEWGDGDGCWVEFGSGCGVVGGFSGWWAAVLDPAQPPPSTWSVLLPNVSQLLPGDSVPSADGLFHLTYQTDGDLVLTRSDGTRAWSSGTAGSSVGFVQLSADGQLAVYNWNVIPVWKTDTPGHPGAVLQVSSTGALRMVDTAGNVLWDSSAQTTGNSGGGTTPQVMTGDSAVRSCENYSDHGSVYQPDAPSCLAYCEASGANACEWSGGDGGCWVEFGQGCGVVGGFHGWWAAVITPSSDTWSDLMPSGLALTANQSVTSADGAFRLTYGSDGNLTLTRQDGTQVWSSNTGGTSTGFVQMQYDGNLVVYDADTVPIFWTSTDLHDGSHLQIGSSGALRIVDTSGVTLWSADPQGVPSNQARQTAKAPPAHDIK